MATDNRRWLDRVIPLPKEIDFGGSIYVRPDRIGLDYAGDLAPETNTALHLLGGFARHRGSGAQFTLYLSLFSGNAPEVQELEERLSSLPYSEQAYAIVPLSESRGLGLLAHTPRGLLNAARTLAQLVRAPTPLDVEATLEMPIVQVIDWPDIEERGQWGGDAESDLEWTAQWKLNVVEAMGQAAIDSEGQPVLNINKQLFRQGKALGVTIVPIILHLEQIAHYAGLMAHSEITSTPDPDKPLPSDYVPGLCMSSPATRELVEGWLTRAAELAHEFDLEGIDVQIWLSEDAAPCYCPRCIGQEPFGLEVACLVEAYHRVRETYPWLRLRLLTTQGSYPVNDRILAAAPEDVGVTYYDGRRTYDSSNQPMIYPLMEAFARSGRWLGVYPQITHVFRTVLPWTAPQFMHYRVQEFATKGLRNVIGYAVPSNRHHEFNVMALAEWSWNARGRSAEDFSRAYATVKDIAEPERYARWALRAGAAGWVFAESRLMVQAIYDRTFWQQGAAFEERFQEFSIMRAQTYEDAVDAARQSLELAREAGEADMIAESEILLAGLEAFGRLRMVAGLLAAPTVSDEGRQELAHSLDRLDDAAATLHQYNIAWGERVASRMDGKLPTRLLDTAAALLRVADRAWALALERGLTDPRPASRRRVLGAWSEEDFARAQKAMLTFDLRGLVPPEGGDYQVTFDYHESDWGVDVGEVVVTLTEDSHQSLLAESPDPTYHIGKWDLWYEKRITLPPTPVDAPLQLTVTLSGTPTDAPPERRRCRGQVGIRRIQEVGSMK